MELFEADTDAELAEARKYHPTIGKFSLAVKPPLPAKPSDDDLDF